MEQSGRNSKWAFFAARPLEFARESAAQVLSPALRSAPSGWKPTCPAHRVTP